MNRNQALAGAALLAALAAGGVGVLQASKVDPDAKDVKQLAEARDAGEAPDYAVYPGERSDGGRVYYGLSSIADVAAIEAEKARLVEQFAFMKAERVDAGRLAADAGWFTLRDAGTGYVVVAPDGGLGLQVDAPLKEKVTFLDGSPCRRRPAKSAPGTCNLRLPDGGERDFGADNVMQAGQWVDRGGCEEAPCAVFFGEAP